MKIEADLYISGRNSIGTDIDLSEFLDCVDEDDFYYALRDYVSELFPDCNLDRIIDYNLSVYNTEGIIEEWLKLKKEHETNSN